MRRWNELGDPSLSLDDLDPDDGWELFVGIDLARTRDLSTAVPVASRTRGDGRKEYRVFTRWTYLPEASITVKQNAEFKAWAKDGWITLLRDADGSPAETMTFRPLVEKVTGLTQRWPSVKACVDRYMAAEVENALAEGGVEVVEVAQGPHTQSEPMRELEAAVIDGRLLHDANPVAAMCVGNLLGVQVGHDAVKPGRENETKKIDVAVGIVNALVLARGGGDDQHVGDLIQ